MRLSRIRLLAKRIIQHLSFVYTNICRNNPEHIWQANFYERASGYKRCPVCNPHPKYKVMLYEMYPELEKYYSKENRRSFKSYALQSNEKPLWTERILLLQSDRADKIVKAFPFRFSYLIIFFHS